MTASPRIAGLVLAAGAGRRFGAPKQLADLDGRPLLAYPLAALAATPGLSARAVALGANAREIAAAVDLQGAEVIDVPEWEEGLAASLRAGVAALAPQADAIVVLLGDQPRVRAADLDKVMNAWDGAAPAVRATYGGAPGHPVLLARPLYPAIEALRGDQGARAVLGAPGVLAVECGPAATLDVDTPAQLDALRTRD